MFSNRVSLPRSDGDFKALVAKVVNKFKLTDFNHAMAVCSVAIRHLPNDQGWTTIDYLGNSVVKNLSNYVVYQAAEKLKHSAEVKSLVDMITLDPNNQQAWDGLTKAADDGSQEAKDALAKLIKEQANQAAPIPVGEPLDNVSPLKA